MKKLRILITFLGLLALSNFALAQAPSISIVINSTTSFPLYSGRVGDAITLSGLNFGTSVSTNVVKFGNGTITSTVTAASLGSSITVNVPSGAFTGYRSEEHTSELQSLTNLV